MCSKKRFVGFLRRFSTLLVALSVVASIGVFSISASAKETNVKIQVFNSDLDYANKLVPFQGSYGGSSMVCRDYRLNNGIMTVGYNVLFASGEASNPLSLRLFDDFWGDYQIDPNAEYTFTYYWSLTGVQASYCSPSATLTIGNLSFQSYYSKVNDNGTRNYRFTGTFRGSDFTKKNSNGSYFSISCDLVNVSAGQWVSYYVDSYFTFTEIKTSSDQVLGGLNSTFGENYSAPDSGAQDEYLKNESALFGSVQSNLEGAVDDWNDLGGTLGEYQGAFAGFNKFFDKLAGLPIISLILIISVALGIFALLLGVTQLFISKKG